MSRENDFITRMQSDATLMALLTGGAYAAQSLTREGITRETTPNAFDSAGYLKPCALVRQRGQVADGMVRDGMAQVVSTRQVVEIYLYCDSSYSPLDTAAARIKVLFEGVPFTGTDGSFPVEWLGTRDRLRDTGALNGAPLSIMEFAVYSVEGD